MSRLTSGGRMERLLSIVPWVVANDGPTVAEIAARFDYAEDRLLEDLNNVLFMVGTYPFTPDQLVEVVLEDDRVWIHYAEYFERPLRLTPDQALALVTAGSSLLAVPGADPDGPLARGLEKLAETLGVTPGSDIEIDLGSASPEILATLREAIADHNQVRIEYYGYNRDEVTNRTVDPYRVTSDQGQWYLLGHCHRAEGERLFRVDRIQGITLTGVAFDSPGDVPEVSVFEPNPDDPRVVLEVSPNARWVIQAYPAEAIEELEGGRARVTLAVSALPWLERLMLRLGSEATIVSSTADIDTDIGVRAAQRVLDRYLG
jgi:proteasome accessory factor C